MISKHISLEEAIESPTALRLGIKNIPTEEELDAMKHVAENLFEPIREWYGKPIMVNSFYRCRELNKAVKGSLTSGHVLGNSIDITAGPKSENKKIFDFIKLSGLEFDQLIWEYGDKTGPIWIHISLKKSGNRKQILHIK
jgi:zinc D-Ala-D-Ala carboxypeptidase